MPKGKGMILDTLFEIKDVVLEKVALKYKKESYGNLLPYLEFKGGKEFFETEDGKAIIEVIFYFAYKWESGEN